MLQMTMHSDSVVEDGYRALASLPLCEAAVVIDVRQSDDASPLLAHLKTELDDLAEEMRYNEIPHWSHLGKCVDVLRLDAVTGYMPVREASDFLIVSPDGKQQSLPGPAYLMNVLGDQYIDRVRTCRLQAPDTGRLDEDGGILESNAASIKRSTVRVFFVADMQEQESLTRAATYAHLLKQWTEHTHGERRTYRNERIHAVVVCLNASAAASYHDVLLQTVGQMPDSAVDTMILLQKYTDEDATVTEEAQINQAELLLYTLILRWPEVLWRRIDDPIEMHPQFMEAAKALPWPTFIIGLSAFEYSARWSMRWLDYGVSGKFLETLIDAEKVDQEQSLIKSNTDKWLDNWWQDLRVVVPDMLSGSVDELQGFGVLRSYARSISLSRGKLIEARPRLEAFRPGISACYSGGGTATLQQAMEKGPSAILDQLRWINEQAGDLAEGERPPLDEPYSRLVALNEKTLRFLGLHFQKAWGSVPRAIYQLSAMHTHIQQVVYETAQHPLETEEFQEQFEREAQLVSDDLGRKLATWQMPLIGRVLPSTVISWLIIIVIGILLLFVPPWQTLLVHGFGARATPSLALWGLRALLLLLLLGCEWFYLAGRNRKLRRYCRQVETRLRNIIDGHLDQVGAVIAARVALPLLEAADLYTQGKDSSPYEQRLRSFKQISSQTKEQANRQQELADTRIPVSPARRAKQPEWLSQIPGLNNRHELIAWTSIKDAFLQSCTALRSNADSNLLAEMLLRLLGTENPVSVLDDLWQNQRWMAGRTSQDRFQAISTLLVALLLSSHVVPPRLADVFPLVQQYDTLKTQSFDDRSMPAGEAIDLRETVRENMLELVRGKREVSMLRFKQKQAMDALVLWANRQHENIPQLREVLASHDLLQHMLNSHMQPSQVVAGLRKQGTLSGVPDEVSGEDSYYLFVGQGADIPRETFLRPLHSSDRQLRLEPFPDCEKLIYLRIHQVRQIFPFSGDTEADAEKSNSVDKSSDAQA